MVETVLEEKELCFITHITNKIKFIGSYAGLTNTILIMYHISLSRGLEIDSN